MPAGLYSGFIRIENRYGRYKRHIRRDRGDCGPMKILLVTDAWHPQINGVVRTLDKTVGQLREQGHQVEVIAPSDGYFTLPLPTYPDIRLAPFAYNDVKRRMLAFKPEAIHIATEGPLGQMAKALCVKWAMPFTTSYHTKFPEYIKARFPFVPLVLALSLCSRLSQCGWTDDGHDTLNGGVLG